MNTNPVLAKHRLAQILLERPEYKVAYHTNAHFRSTVDSVVAAMPAVLKAAYDTAEEFKERRESTIAAMMAQPPAYHVGKNGVFSKVPR